MIRDLLRFALRLLGFGREALDGGFRRLFGRDLLVGFAGLPGRLGDDAGGLRKSLRVALDILAVDRPCEREGLRAEAARSGTDIDRACAIQRRRFDQHFQITRADHADQFR